MGMVVNTGGPMDRNTIKSHLRNQKIEMPSWGFAATGTRFGKFPQPWSATNLAEKLDDAAQAQKFTGILPTVALHIPWDMTDDWAGLKVKAAERNLTIGAINPNLFQDPAYQFGSYCNPDAKIRAKAVAQTKTCIEVMKATGSDCLSMWFADGTNYPGQDDFRARRRRLVESFQQVYADLPANSRMIIEYKFFEPASYHTDLADWGSAALLCKTLGPKAQVLVDTGHHPLGTNIEWIVACLLDEGILGGFHFNSRKYADDDLTVGSINPFELFLIYNELVAAEMDNDAKVRDCAKRVAYMFDQCHQYKNTIEATITSATNCQEALAKALHVDHAALAKARIACDVTGAEEILKDAYQTDVRPLLREVRQDMGLDPEPLAAFRRSGYAERAIAQRTAKHAAAGAGGGF
jgi:L-rhamnose isomerase/sugar isomerase